MDQEERLNKQKDLIEQIGILCEKNGFSPIAGRILGLLIVMDKRLFTFDEIVETLQISKSSASNAIQTLLSRKMIEYKTLSGDRKRYFQIRTHSKFSFIEEIDENMNRMNELLTNILELRNDPNSENAQQLKTMLEMNKIILRYIYKLKDEVKNYNNL